MNLNKLFPQILLGYVDNKGCTLSTNECNELTKYVSGLELELTTAQEENKRYKAALEKAYEASAMFPTGNIVFDKKMMDDVYNAVQSALNGGKNG